MELMDIISGGDLISKKHYLRERCEKIAKGLRERGGEAFSVSLEDSQKEILFPIFDGLGIPYRDEAGNGVFFGRDKDTVDKLCNQI